MITETSSKIPWRNCIMRTDSLQRRPTSVARASPNRDITSPFGVSRVSAINLSPFASLRRCGVKRMRSGSLVPVSPREVAALVKPTNVRRLSPSRPCQPNVAASSGSPRLDFTGYRKIASICPNSTRHRRSQTLKGECKRAAARAGDRPTHSSGSLHARSTASSGSLRKSIRRDHRQSGVWKSGLTTKYFCAQAVSQAGVRRHTGMRLEAVERGRRKVLAQSSRATITLRHCGLIPSSSADVPHLCRC